MLESNDVNAKYKMAFELFEKGKYSKSASMFESLKLAVRGTSKDDTVQFYTAYSYYKFGDPMAAEQSFYAFINTFPRSKLINQARFLYIDCLYEETYRYELDQTPTYKAIGVINEYLVDFPETEHRAQCEDMLADLSERLDRKSYEAAKLYYKIEDYKAAHYALKLLLKEEPTNIYKEDIMYYTVMAAYKYASNSIAAKQKDRYMVFVDEYFTFLGEYPESEYRRQLDGLAKKVQRVLGTDMKIIEDNPENEKVNVKDSSRKNKRKKTR